MTLMPAALPLSIQWQSKKIQEPSSLNKYLREWGHTMRRDNQVVLPFDQIWRVIPCSTPKIIRKCTRCNENRFCSSDKFRVNANKKIIDAWLIYKCIRCDFTLKLVIITRTAVSKIDRTLLERLHGNDQVLATQYAFETSLLKEMQLDWEIDFVVEGQSLRVDSELDLNNDKMYIMIKSEYYLKIPIFSILRKKLECSRNKLQKLEKRDALRVYSLTGGVLDLKNQLGVGCIINMLRVIS